MKRLVVLLALVASPAYAVDHTITVNDQELQTIGDALQRPLQQGREAANLMNKLQQQLQPKQTEPSKEGPK